MQCVSDTQSAVPSVRIIVSLLYWICFKQQIMLVVCG